MGDGSPCENTESEIMSALVEGSEDAADRGKIQPLTDDEYKHLLEIFCSPYKFVSVEPGNEVILTYDAATLKIRRGGGVTVADHPPVDIVSRSSKAMVEICRLDGL